MKKNGFSRTSLFIALSLAMTLTACGGGGGGSTATSSGTGTSSSSTSSTLSSPQYASGSAQLAAFNQVNTMRQQCGFPALSENTLLDVAAVNHLTYMGDNKYLGHSETSGNAGYTGATPQARASAVGYTGNAGEVFLADTTNIGGTLAVIGLASLPYHEDVLFSPTSDIGIGYQSLVFGPSTTYYTLEAMLGYTGAGSQLSGTPLTFPCQGTTGVDYESHGAEDPTPYINGQPVNLQTNPIGTPVAIVGNLSDTIVLNSGVMTDSLGNQTSLNLLDSGNDPNQALAPYVAEAFPTSPLQPNTTYSATITGTDNGTAFSRNFSFTTGNQGQF